MCVLYLGTVITLRFLFWFTRGSLIVSVLACLYQTWKQKFSSQVSWFLGAYTPGSDLLLKAGWLRTGEYFALSCWTNGYNVASSSHLALWTWIREVQSLKEMTQKCLQFRCYRWCPQSALDYRKFLVIWNIPCLLRQAYNPFHSIIYIYARLHLNIKPIKRNYLVTLSQLSFISKYWIAMNIWAEYSSKFAFIEKGFQITFHTGCGDVHL